MNRITAMDENIAEIKSPIKRLGSTRKILLFNNIRLQLNEQLRCLDIRVESQISLIQELQDFFRRRGEVELDYSKSLEKLAKSLQLRHKEQKQKRELWPMFSSYACWQQLVQQTKSLARDHAIVADIYSTQMVVRLQTVYDDCHRIYKKCREIGYEIHEEILRVLQELHTTMKTYHTYQTECKEAEKKLRAAETQRTKIQQSIAKEKLERSKKFKVVEKEVMKRKNKYTDARLKTLKAKNEYQLCLEASNTTIHKYFVEDLSDLIDCMDLGFHSVISRALLLHVNADQGRCRTVLANSEILSNIIHSMDSRADKQKFLEQYHAAFMIPKRLEFQGQQEDLLMKEQQASTQPGIIAQVENELQKALSTDMDARLVQLETRVTNLKIESDEIWKSLETTETNLLEILNTKDYDVSTLLGGPGSDNSSTHSFQQTFNHQMQQQKLNDQTASINMSMQKMRSDKQDVEEYYLKKIREYILCTSRVARLDSKAEFLKNALLKDSAPLGNALIKQNVPKRKRIGRMNITGRPKLFGGSLEEYIEATGEDIPVVMRSCVRVINLYGLHHQGIFRVSGSQVEISNFREWFERGDDPLADTTDASDINSVAGVLKLYLRELREPLFPIIYFEHFIALAQLESKHDIVSGIRKFLQNLPRCIIIVMRYLFAFLHHLSEYSDENMMDAYNLAICFGPTLMPAPEDKDQVQYQNQVNELVKNMIVYHDELFSKDIGGHRYEKFISQEPYEDMIDPGDSPTEQTAEDADSEVYQSEDDCSDTFEATALFDFNARSDRELALRKGDNVQLYNQVSNDWWRGAVNGKIGLVPDKYISVKIKDEDREKSSDQFLLKSSSSEESVRKRTHSNGASGLVKCTLSVATVSCDSNSVSSNGHGPIITTTSLDDSLDKIDATSQDSSETVAISQIVNIRHAPKYHDEPHSFENTVDYLVVAPPLLAKGISVGKQETPDENDSLSTHNTTIDERPDNEIIYSNSHFKFETKDLPPEPIYAEPTKTTPQQRLSSSSDTPTTNKTLPTSEYQPLNIFQQNREKWQKLTNTESKEATPGASTQSSSILTSRNRFQPDLVQDLPLTQQDTTPPLSSGTASASSSTTSLDQLQTQITEDPEDGMTLGECFAKQNQCTLKKNEKFLDHSPRDKKALSADSSKYSELTTSTNNRNSIDDVVLRIDESGDSSENRLSTGSIVSNKSSTLKIDMEKSPIPLRNTQKFVSQFADLKLTGGCNTIPTKPPVVQEKPEKERSSFISSFKPQLKVKPTLLGKKNSTFLQGHSSSDPRQ